MTKEYFSEEVGLGAHAITNSGDFGSISPGKLMIKNSFAYMPSCALEKVLVYSALEGSCAASQVNRHWAYVSSRSSQYARTLYRVSKYRLCNLYNISCPEKRLDGELRNLCEGFAIAVSCICEKKQGRIFRALYEEILADYIMFAQNQTFSEAFSISLNRAYPTPVFLTIVYACVFPTLMRLINTRLVSVKEENVRGSGGEESFATKVNDIIEKGEYFFRYGTQSLRAAPDCNSEILYSLFFTLGRLWGFQFGMACNSDQINFPNYLLTLLKFGIGKSVENIIEQDFRDTDTVDFFVEVSPNEFGHKLHSPGIMSDKCTIFRISKRLAACLLSGILMEGESGERLGRLLIFKLLRNELLPVTMPEVEPPVYGILESAATCYSLGTYANLDFAAELFRKYVTTLDPQFLRTGFCRSFSCFMKPLVCLDQIQAVRDMFKLGKSIASELVGGLWNSESISMSLLVDALTHDSIDTVRFLCEEQGLISSGLASESQCEKITLLWAGACRGIENERSRTYLFQKFKRCISSTLALVYIPKWFSMAIEELDKTRWAVFEMGLRMESYKRWVTRMILWIENQFSNLKLKKALRFAVSEAIGGCIVNCFWNIKDTSFCLREGLLANFSQSVAPEYLPRMLRVSVAYLSTKDTRLVLKHCRMLDTTGLQPVLIGCFIPIDMSNPQSHWTKVHQIAKLLVRHGAQGISDKYPTRKLYPLNFLYQFEMELHLDPLERLSVTRIPSTTAVDIQDPCLDFDSEALIGRIVYCYSKAINPSH
eukprot:Nk52_evm76s270 gene=Nk52_evmTU76s270